MTRFSIASTFLFGLFATTTAVADLSIPSEAIGKRVTVATYFAEFLPGLRAVAPEFKERTGIELQVQGVPYAQYRFWVQTRFLAQDAPEILILEGTTDPWQYGQSGLLIDVGEIVSRPNRFTNSEAKWVDSFREELLQFSYDANGRLFLLPFTQFGVGFFYNADLYEGIGLEPPETWTEFKAMLAQARESPLLAARRISPMTVAVRPDDAQSLWTAAIILECFMRTHIPAVNLRLTDPEWRFDAADPQSVTGERIDLTERIFAFANGTIDPARSPEFRATAKMVKELVPYWRPDFLALSGEELYRLFASGRSLHFMNGTWYLKDIVPLQQQMREVAPEAVFEFGTFPFPELDGEYSNLVRAGGVNQNAGLRSCLLIPRQPREPWREEAAILLAEFLTAPEIAQKVFNASNVFDIPAVEGVLAKPESQPLLPETTYPFLPLAYFEGYDSQAISEFWPAWQAFLSGPATDEELDRFLQRLSRSHRDALGRLLNVYRSEVDADFLRSQLGDNWEAEW